MSEVKDKPALCGFLNVLKPPGMTSAQVVGFVRRLMGGVKVGHAGTLDPEAAGVLPLMIGKAARLFDYMQEKEKAYVAEVAFGAATDTQDAQGQAIAWGENYPSKQGILAALPAFRGEIWQKPPMFSAIRMDGKRLYELAWEGKEAEVPRRQVTVHRLELLEMTEPKGALLEVACSKGFYVRTLCQDLGEALRCPSHMRFLLRVRSGVFTLETARTLETLKKAAEQGTLEETLLPPEAGLPHLPKVQVPEKCRSAFLHGGTLKWAAFPEGKDLEEGVPVGFWMDERLAAIGVRQEGLAKLKTWLLD